MPRFLLSEALRGEGAWLVNAAGERFMHRYHALLELAPRDVVARAITREGTGGKPVYLDMRHVGAKKDLRARFPGISAFLAKYQLELGRDLIPVRPAAHYLMGGVKTDVHGRTSLTGLYAAGEVACTGVHGANRLASNSLLEGLVFGVLAAETMVAEAPVGETKLSVVPGAVAAGDTSEAATERWIAELRGLMWKHAGLLRNGRSDSALRAGEGPSYTNSRYASSDTRNKPRALEIAASDSQSSSENTTPVGLEKIPTIRPSLPRAPTSAMLRVEPKVAASQTTSGAWIEK